MCIGLYVRRNKPYMKSLVLKRKDRFETMKKGSFEPVVNSFELELTVRGNSQPVKTFSGPEKKLSANNNICNVCCATQHDAVAAWLLNWGRDAVGQRRQRNGHAASL